MKVRNIESTRTNGTIPNQFIIESDGKIAFQSYQSVIADVDYANARITIGEDYDYSRTTGKYRNTFFEEIGFYELATLNGIRNAISNGSVDIGGRHFDVVLVGNDVISAF